MPEKWGSDDVFQFFLLLLKDSTSIKRYKPMCKHERTKLRQRPLKEFKLKNDELFVQL